MSPLRWIPNTEWWLMMGAMVGCFLFVHAESVHINERLDDHMTHINMRCDDLHQEFYSLLKEIHKNGR